MLFRSAIRLFVTNFIRNYLSGIIYQELWELKNFLIRVCRDFHEFFIRIIYQEFSNYRTAARMSFLSRIIGIKEFYLLDLREIKCLASLLGGGGVRLHLREISHYLVEVCMLVTRHSSPVASSCKVLWLCVRPVGHC